MNNYISIIIPVYNRTNLLKRAIESVLKQSYKYFELIIVDDNSTENIFDMIESFNDQRIIYIKNDENKGVSYSRNIGIKKSKYDYIAFLDSDDEWKKDKLKIQIDFFQKNSKYRLVHTNEIWIKNGKFLNQKKIHKKSGGDIFIPSLHLCLISPSSVMIKKEIFQDYGFFDESLIVCEDYDMWLRILSFEEVGFIEKPLIIKYGGHNDQLSKKYEAMDKYRVKSLYKIYNLENLSYIKKSEVKKVLIEKLNILINGAKKRNKLLDLEIYNELLNKIV